MIPLLLATGSDSDPAITVGPLEVSDAALDAVVVAGWRILVILLISILLVRVGRRLIRRAVERVKHPDRGPMDRLKRTLDGDRDDDPIAQARRERRAEAMASVGGSALGAAVWSLAVLTILAAVGINLGPYIAGLGIVGVALGFGAQDLVKDFISGVFMLLEDQYGVGDIVDSGEASGVVEGISLRTTRIRSVDGTLWYVPNGEIRRLGNMSQGWARALLDIAVAYDTDVDHASRVIMSVAEDLAEEEDFRDRFLAEPEVWGVERFGADSIDIRLVIRTTPGDQWAIGRELRRRLKQAFDEHGIEIPFPQRTLWIRDGSGAAFPGTDDVGAGDGDGGDGDGDGDVGPDAAEGTGAVEHRGQGG